MAGSYSDYLENKILDHQFGGPDYVRPSSVYLGAFLVSPNDSGGGTEVSAIGYERLQVENNTTNFPAAEDGIKTNGTMFEFIEATNPWGVVVAIGIFDAKTGGNLLGYADSISKDIKKTDALRIKPGSLTIVLN